MNYDFKNKFMIKIFGLLQLIFILLFSFHYSNILNGYIFKMHWEANNFSLEITLLVFKCSVLIIIYIEN